jgi:hypothetical protein
MNRQTAWQGRLAGIPLRSVLQTNGSNRKPSKATPDYLGVIVV